MLLISLFLTVLVLVVANAVAWRSRKLGVACVICALGAFLGLPCVALPAHVLSGLSTLVLTGLACLFVSARPRVFLACSLAATAGSYGLVGMLALTEIRERARLWEEYRPQSMAVRLAYETRHAETTSEPNVPTRATDDSATPAGKQLAELEDHIDSFDGRARMRTRALQRLHENSVADFIDSPGFGIGRRIEPNRRYIELPDAEPIPLPAPHYVPPDPGPELGTPPSALSAGPGDAIASLPREDALGAMHRDSVVDFVNPQGFGYIQDREHVKGFQAHQFRQMPRLQESEKEKQRWRIQTLELLSLLKHQEPVAYLSENLPRMDELRGAKTRPLISFEKSALAELRRGEDLKIESAFDSIRMVGSIRAVKQCLSCHHAQRGNLLGAFSYTLLRDATVPEQAINSDGQSHAADK